MSVKIRLMRVGKTKQPSYRVVVADSRSPRDGRIIETIGHYRPRQDPSHFDIDDEKALNWLRNGAQPSEQVQKLLAVHGLWATFEAEKEKKPDTKLNRRGYVTGKHTELKRKKKEVPEEAAPPAAAAPADEAPAAEADAPAEVAAEEVPAAEAPAEEAPAADESAAEESSE
ncbi:MAG: 30S ribosomal protein S16 [Actinobacteria bacterium]|nr:30S ribosomal protein S16 [Actinomycetota bacterium]